MATTYQDCRALVLGTNAAGLAAAGLLVRQGAHVTALPGREAVDAGTEAQLRAVGVQLGTTHEPAPGQFDLGVVAVREGWQSPWVAALRREQQPVLSELELGYQESRCLHLAIAGTNGKSTAAGLVTRVLESAHRQVARAGGDGPPVTALAEVSRDLEFLVVEVSMADLAGLQHYRPVVAVLLNWVPAAERALWPGDVRAGVAARLFGNQQLFDWAVVQSEALAQLRSEGRDLPSKLITFSADNRRADLVLDRGLLLSRMEDWAGPLLDMAQCRLQGPHFAEDLMAALAVGRILRVPLELMAEELKSAPVPSHCCERVAEMDGVRFVSDAKAVNLHALQRAISAMPPIGGAEPNVILIAGGVDVGAEFHDAGPLLSRRVKQAILLGPASIRMRAAWSLFTPCTLVETLLEAVERSAEIASPGDVVLLSPACPSHGLFGSIPPQGEVFRQAVQAVIARRGSGRPQAGPESNTAAEHKRFSPSPQPRVGPIQSRT